MAERRREFRKHVITASPPPRAKATRLNACLLAVAEACEVTVEELRGRRTHHRVFRARALAVGIIWERCPEVNVMQIARAIDKDHTCVCNARNRLPQILEDDPWLARCRLEALSMLGAAR